MKPLVFNYGTMCAGKSMHLLSLYTDLQIRGKRTLLCKPYVDDLWSMAITSRCGLKGNVNIKIKKDEIIHEWNTEGIYAVFIDDAQFLSDITVAQLRELTKKVPVYCYGLKTNYLGKLFEGSKALLECADIIQEFRVMCHFCDAYATHILRLKGGNDEIEVEMPGEMNYAPVCYKCWSEKYDQK